MENKMQDIKASEIDFWKQYQDLFVNKNISGIIRLINSNPTYKYKVFNSYNWNRLINLINDGTLPSEFWDNTKTYNEYDIVRQQNYIYIALKQNINVSPQQNTNTWKQLSYFASLTDPTDNSLVGLWKNDYQKLDNARSNFFVFPTYKSDVLYRKNNLVVVPNGNAYYCIKDTEWTDKTWNGLTDFYGISVWKGKKGVYYSRGTSQYVLNEETSTWEPKTWNGFSNFSGNNVWQDGENIYLSDGSNQYIIDEETSTLTEKTWNGMTSFYGVNVWNYNGTYFYSFNYEQRVLDKATSTWNLKKWNGLTNFLGSLVWSDDNGTYYSNETEQYAFDGNEAWSFVKWTGLTNFSANGIWHDGANVYYDSSYILLKGTHSWVKANWNSSHFSGLDVWGNGPYYYSYGSIQRQIECPPSTENTEYWLLAKDFVGIEVAQTAPTKLRAGDIFFEEQGGTNGISG